MSKGRQNEPQASKAGTFLAANGGHVMRRICLLYLATLLTVITVGHGGSARTPAIVPAGASQGAVISIATAKNRKHIFDKLKDIVSEKRDIEEFRIRLEKIRQRTKTRQLDGISNVNVMEWTTNSDESPVMNGALVFLKDIAGAYSFIDEQAMSFIRRPPRDWDYFGEYSEIAKQFSGGDIDVVNFLLMKMYFWFRAHKSFIGNFGGIIAFYEPKDGAILVIYSDKNRYKENNVSSFLTNLKNLNSVDMSEDVFVVESGRGDFQHLVLEKEGGPVAIEVPYIRYDVPIR